MRSFRVLGLLVIAGIVLGASAYAGLSALGAQPRSDGALSLGALVPCGGGTPVPISMLAKSSKALPSAAKFGFEQAGFDDGSVVVYPLTNRVDAVDIAPAALGPDVKMAPMYAQTTDERYRSCDMHLEDNPRALALSQQAIPLMEKAGYLTAADVDDAANIWFLSDHPFNADELVLTMVLHGEGQDQVEHPRGTVSAIIDRQSGTVLSVGEGNLYASCAAMKDCSPN